MSAPDLLTQISSWIILLPFLIGLPLYRKLDRDSRWVFGLVSLALIPQILTPFWNHTAFLGLVYNIYTPVEFILTFGFLGLKLQRRSFRVLSWIPVGGFLLISVWLIYRFGVQDRFLNEWVCAANISYLCWVFLLILESLLNEVKLLNGELPLFWYITGLLLYTPCTIFVFSLCYYINTSQHPLIRRLWMVQSVFNTTLYVCYAIGLYRNVFFNNFPKNARVENRKPFQ
jgi:hypothetical protein